ncbi:hypothetical protein OnM2_023026 [Erysiphe neolycopersici]|uniref:Uncharacterized protein n=1 Tax=Erysiphe neolycopersici TaxID=212602 RepID=A0A420I240_9PEZI|nr:hypothetical protein OnM2_023026 [Erysiphe neolycopersici]
MPIAVVEGNLLESLWEETAIILEAKAFEIESKSRLLWRTVARPCLLRFYILSLKQESNKN